MQKLIQATGFNPHFISFVSSLGIKLEENPRKMLATLHEHSRIGEKLSRLNAMQITAEQETYFAELGYLVEIKREHGATSTKQISMPFYVGFLARKLQDEIDKK